MRDATAQIGFPRLLPDRTREIADGGLDGGELRPFRGIPEERLGVSHLGNRQTRAGDEESATEEGPARGRVRRLHPGVAIGEAVEDYVRCGSSAAR